jgi:GH35 family endo-1,4-beta-xylanase
MKTLFIAMLLLLQIVCAQTTGLKDVYAPYFKFGNILNGTTVNNSSMKTLLLREFNSVTPENELKPDATIVASGSTNTDVKVTLNSSARAILKFCEDNNIPVRGHTLVWHSQTPGWFFREGFSSSGAVVSKAVMSQRMESYIKNMFALIYKDYPNLDLYAYDVVNEAASESGSPRTAGSDAGSGQSMWVQVYGNNSFVEEAFTHARKYAKP